MTLMPATFGTIRTDDEIEDAVTATLKKWLPTYMSEVERQLNLTPPYYERPSAGSFTTRTDFDKFPEDMLPLIVIVSTGVEDDPVREGRGFYRARYVMGVTNIVSSTEEVFSRQYAYRMGAAIRAALIHHQSLDRGVDGDVRGVDWLGSRNDELGSEDGRTIWACRQAFSVEVAEVLQRGVGPVGPTDPEVDPDPTVPDPPDDPDTPDPPYPPLPTVQHTDVDLDKEPVS